jgi:hypothetical protein
MEKIERLILRAAVCILSYRAIQYCFNLFKITKQNGIGLSWKKHLTDVFICDMCT